MLDEVLDIVHHVLVMSVNPGFGGQKFFAERLRKIESLANTRAKRGLNFRIEADGRHRADTVADVVRAGAEAAGSGECRFGGGNIGENVRKLLQAAKGAKLARA